MSIIGDHVKVRRTALNWVVFKEMHASVADADLRLRTQWQNTTIWQPVEAMFSVDEFLRANMTVRAARPLSVGYCGSANIR
jgi:hypothetical protein